MTPEEYDYHMFTRFKVDLPTGVVGDWEVKRVLADPDAVDFKIENLTAAITGHNYRTVRPGVYTLLVGPTDYDEDGNPIEFGVVMGDTHAEIEEHREFLNRLEDKTVKRVLINGLGLGMCLAHALRQPHIEHVDVVELNYEVIDLVWQVYSRDKRAVIHHKNALTAKFPPNTTWDLVWHDIWPTISKDNIDQMSLLNRKYGHRCRWQGTWSEELVR